MTEPIISVSGLRGIVGESLTPDVARRYVTAFAATLPPGPIIVSRDGRANGPMLMGAVISALRVAGRDVFAADIAATPTLGVLVRVHRAAGGVQISASHNPPEYNGIKLFSGEGRVIPAEPGRRVLKAYRAGQSSWVRNDRFGKQEQLADTTSDHLNALLTTVDAAEIRGKKVRVLLDSNRGAGSLLGAKLLEALGCEVVLLGAETDGQFEHPPEPTAENLQTVTRKVISARADIGFCQDPDADRLAIIDETGRYIGEEYTLAICVDHVLRQRKGPVVTNCATSRMTQDVAEKYGVPYFRSAVGEANVVDEMLARDAVFGGEGNGGPIDPRVGLVRDSFVGMALVLGAMTSRDKKISELAAELPRYEIRKTTIKLLPEKLPAALEALQQRFPEAQADRLDGLRLDWPDQWLIVRGSNTEPIVRAIAEAPTAAAAEELCGSAAEIIARLA
ncbi:MAG: phosphoglucosamine mutase [Pirellulaceae bacterium]|nr:phosphoglucosamine mutase [Pirellulaceae bacterium]